MPSATYLQMFLRLAAEIPNAPWEWRVWQERTGLITAPWNTRDNPPTGLTVKDIEDIKLFWDAYSEQAYAARDSFASLKLNDDYSYARSKLSDWLTKNIVFSWKLTKDVDKLMMEYEATYDHALYLSQTDPSASGTIKQLRWPHEALAKLLFAQDGFVSHPMFTFPRTRRSVQRFLESLITLAFQRQRKASQAHYKKTEVQIDAFKHRVYSLNQSGQACSLADLTQYVKDAYRLKDVLDKTLDQSHVSVQDEVTQQIKLLEGWIRTKGSPSSVAATEKLPMFVQNALPELTKANKVDLFAKAITDSM